VLTVIEHLATVASGAAAEESALAGGEGQIGYAELYRRVRQYAGALRDLGVQPGERVGTWLQKGVDQVALILACLEANAVAVPIHTSLTPGQVRWIARDCQLRLLLVEPMRARVLTDLPPACRLMSVAGPAKEDLPSLAELSGGRPDRRGRHRPDPDANAVILYTAAGTEPSIGIVFAHRDLVARGERTAERLALRPGDRVSGIVCPNLAYGLDHLWASLAARAVLYLHGAVFSSDALVFLDRHRIRHLPLLQVTAARLFDRRLLSAEAPSAIDSVRRVALSGGRVSARLLGQLEERFPRATIEVLYGLSETGIVARSDSDTSRGAPDTLGEPLEGIEILVLDEDGERSPRGAVGEIAVRGADLFRGYWNRPAITAERMRRPERFGGEPIFFTGDLGVVASDGSSIELRGRRDGLIKSHGHRISPLQVEEAVREHEQVAAAVAFGARNDEIGEDIAVIYSTLGSDEPAPSDLRAHLASRLPRFMLPRWLLSVPDLPGDATGTDAVHAELVASAARRLGVEVG
jgi:acyl-CoA synthetase (AMP-forming)/AMP-acid ligase II